MSSFTAQSFEKKLFELNNSAPSIQSLSLWLIHHRKHAQRAVQIWKSHLLKAGSPQRQLTLIYLANDVAQNGKRKAAEFGSALSDVIVDVFRHVGSVDAGEGADRQRILASLRRLLDVWQERQVFPARHLAACRRALSDHSPKSASEPDGDGGSDGGDGGFKQPLPPTPTGNSSTTSPITPTAAVAPRKRQHTNKPRSSSSPGSSSSAAAAAAVSPSAVRSPSHHSAKHKQRRHSQHAVRPAEVKEVEVEGVKEKHITLSPHSPQRDPPEPSELIQALEELENSASADAATRQQIASLPADMCDLSVIDRLVDKVSGERLLAEIGEAARLLDTYNGRLGAEMEGRRRLTLLLHDFTQAQKDLLAQAERTLQEYRVKLEQIYLVREELKAHIANLPDIGSLPSVTGVTVDLPSACDLFS